MSIVVGTATGQGLTASKPSADYWGPRLAALVVLIWLSSLVIGIGPGVSLLNVLGYAAAILGLRYPALGLMGVGVLCTLDSVTRDFHNLLIGGFLRYNTFNYWLLVVLLINAPFLLKLCNIQVRLLEGFLAVLTIGLLFSVRQEEGASDVLQVASAFGLLVYFYRASRDPRAWFWLAVLSGVVSAVGCFVLRLEWDSLPRLDRSGVALIPLAAICTSCLAVGVNGGWRRGHWILGLLTAVNYGWIVLSTSRGGLLVGSVGVVFLIMQVRGTARRIACVAGAGLLGLAVLLSSAERAAYTFDRMRSLFDPNEAVEVRSSGRSDLALAGWYMFLEHPMGVGTGDYQYAWLTLRHRGSLSLMFAGKEMAAHSGWVRALAENGIPGILLLGALVLSFAALGLGYRHRSRRALALGLLVFAVWAVALLSYEYTQKALWLLATGVIVFLHRDALLQAHGQDQLS
jgi:O-antigen ligase